MSRQVKAGTTNVSVVIRIIDSTDGTPETGVVFDTAGIDLEYRREGAASVDITEATLAALTTAHADGGFLHIGNGYYRLDLPDAACAAGVTGVLVHGTVTDMVVIGEYIELVAYDPYDTVRLGLTALPNAAADAAGGLIISDAGGLDADAQAASVTAIEVDTSTTLQAELDGIQADTEDIQARLPAALVNSRMDATIDATGFEAAAVDLIWDEAKAGHVGVGSFGEEVQAHALSTEVSALNDLSAAEVNAEVDTALGDYDGPTKAEMDTAHALLSTQATQDTIDTVVDAIKAVTDLLPNAGLTTQLTEAYAAQGVVPTLVQLVFEMRAILAELSTSGTTATAKKVDGSTTAATYTLDDDTAPTSITRAT
jgi:hypothetical protein